MRVDDQDNNVAVAIAVVIVVRVAVVAVGWKIVSLARWHLFLLERQTVVLTMHENIPDILCS